MPSDGSEVFIDLGVVRDQGTRPTCLSFAISDVHRSRLLLPDLLSPESLHNAASQVSGTSITAAMSVGDCLTALKETGQTKEAEWPYHSGNCLSATARFFKREGKLTPFDASKVEALLHAGNPPAVILNIGLEFFQKTDDVPIEASNALPAQACHAVVLTGTRLTGKRRHFRLRNSWGPNWGFEGQAWVSAEYLELRSSGFIRLA